MSNLRHDLLVRTYAVTHPPNLHLQPRAFDDWNQLVYASRGIMDVTTPVGRWVVPPHRAVWIPARTRHGVEMSGRVAIRTLFFRRGIGRGRVPRECQILNVSTLLRELILHVASIGILRRSVPSQARLAHVILDQIDGLREAPLQLPMPTEPRALRAAEALLQRAGEADTVQRAVRIAGASRRTLERLFLEETKMTLGRWHQRVRLIESLRRLAAGHTVHQVALEVGYRTPSAFVAAFHKQLGITPARYFRRLPQEPR